jgi:phosphatidate cytidylyltransferase
MAPIAIGAVWFGWPWLPILTAVAAAVMAWEWARLCRIGEQGLGPARLDSPGSATVGTAGVVLIGAVVLPVAAAAATQTAAAIGLAIAGSAAVLGAARRERGWEPVWLASGALWIALPCVLFLWLARIDDAGRAILLWILAVVWATDIGAFAFGKQIGGPLLAPRWSPRKTWAGLLGGAGCAALVGLGTARLLDLPSALPLVLLSAGLAIVGQFGDLAESAAKRRFGGKDSSDLIPGHGGLLDRLDGLLAVIVAAALLTLIGGGKTPVWP